MDINATLLGQALVFGILIWFSWQVHLAAVGQARSTTARRRSPTVWPPLNAARRSCRAPTAKRRSSCNEAREKAQEDRRPGEQAFDARSSMRRAAPPSRRASAWSATPGRKSRSNRRGPVTRCARKSARWPSPAPRGCSQREIDPKAHADLIEQLAREIERRQGLSAAPQDPGVNDAWPREPRSRDLTPGRHSPMRRENARLDAWSTWLGTARAYRAERRIPVARAAARASGTASWSS